MHPSFEQFVAALRDPAQRPGIGLAISDEDASTLLTNPTWVNDYYAGWIALFPPETAAPAPSLFPPATAAPAPSPAPSPFGPPPTVPPRETLPAATVDAPVWAASPRRTLPAPARIAIIAVLTLVGLSVVAGVINEVAALTRAPLAASVKTPTVAPPSPGASTGDQNDPVVFHGLTQTEYNLLEAVLAPQGHTLEQAVANGTDDAELQRLAVSTESSTAKTCTDGEALDNGFDNATFRTSFIAGYEATQKATPAQAAAVYDALAAYCDAH